MHSILLLFSFLLYLLSGVIMALDDSWYTEQWAGQGSAISLKLRDKVHDERSPYQRIEI